MFAKRPLRTCCSTCAAVGAGLTLAAGGTLKQAFIGAAISFVQMGAYAGIHQVIGGIANATVGSFETGALTSALSLRSTPVT